MPGVQVERHLAAILAADIAGYSRLMEQDEEGTLARLKACRREISDPAISSHGGRIVKTTGDGMLVTFSSVTDAVNCAVGIQRGMAAANAGRSTDGRIEYRIGINVGDVIEDGDDIFGNGVNIAARLEAIADRGGICISRQVLDQIDGKLDLDVWELGRQNLKNIGKPIEVYAIDLNGGSPASRVLSAANLKQEIRYCRAVDGVRLAYATVGSGPPVIRPAHWLGHLEYDWELPIFRHLLLGIARDFRLVRYDARGNGLSDWDVGNVSLEHWVSDLGTVADAAGLARFPLLAFSQSAAVSIAYAVRHPERVSRLVICGGFATGRWKRPNLTEADRERIHAMTTLMRVGWGAADSTFRQLFTSLLIPTATKEQADAFNELQRMSASPECAVRYFETVNQFDVRDLLAEVRVPTLIMHVRGDSIPIELGQELAAGIPGARFVALPGKNHILLEQDAAMPRFLEEVREFLSADE